MKQISYNLEKLIKITVRDILECNNYKYVEKYKNFWGKIKPAYIQYVSGYRIGDEPLKSFNDLPSECFIKDKIIYWKADCKLYFQDDYAYTYWFNTYQEALDKANEIKLLSGNKYLTIK